MTRNSGVRTGSQILPKTLCKYTIATCPNVPTNSGQIADGDRPSGTLHDAKDPTWLGRAVGSKSWLWWFLMGDQYDDCVR